MPKYLKLLKNEKKVEYLKKYARSLWKECVLCGFRCGVNREKYNGPHCKGTPKIKVASFAVHDGEEPVISGKNGAGNVFFSGCSLECMFCQNYPISQYTVGKELSIEEFADKLLYLQNVKKVHNINLVTATHYVPSIFEGVLKAAEKGLKIPIIYNTSGYDSLDTYYLLREFIDVFLPDFKYSDNERGKKYSGIPDFYDINFSLINAILEDYPKNEYYKNGLIKKGMIIRHLVLPFDTKNTYEVVDILADISTDLTLSVMSQYFPAYKAVGIFDKKLDKICYNKIIDYLEKKGFKKVWIQEIP